MPPTPRAISACLCAALLLGGCERAPETRSEPPPARAVPVVVAHALARPVTRWIDVVGTLEADEEVLVAAKVGGRVTAVAADLGDSVAPGAALARVDPADYELAARQARASLLESLAQLGLEALPESEFDLSRVARVRAAEIEAANAAARRDRAKTMLERASPAVSAQEYADLETAAAIAEANVAVAREEARALLAAARTREAELALAEQALRDTTVLAPVPPGAPDAAGGPAPVYGVAERRVSVGAYVTPGTPMFRLVDADPIRFRVRVPELSAQDVRVGQPAEALPRPGAPPIAGTVSRVSPAIDPQSRTCEVEIRIDNPGGAVRPGGFARGRIAVREDEGVTFVPEAALVAFAGVERVYSVRDGKAVEHRVQSGVRVDGLVEIVSGLAAPADVVVQGQARLAPGAPVEARPAADAGAGESSR